MISLTISDEKGRVLHRLRFDDANVVYEEGKIIFVHRRLEPPKTARELWNRVAQVASRLALGKPLAGEELSSAYYILDDDCYRLERDPGETESDYRERAKMLGCNERGVVRLPRGRSRVLAPAAYQQVDSSDIHEIGA